MHKTLGALLAMAFIASAVPALAYNDNDGGGDYSSGNTKSNKGEGAKDDAWNKSNWVTEPGSGGSKGKGGKSVNSDGTTAGGGSGASNQPAGSGKTKSNED